MFTAISSYIHVSSYILHAASSPSPYSWNSEDSKMIENVDLILAADGKLPSYSCCITLILTLIIILYHAAIYDDSITEAFIWCLVKCVLRIKKTVSIIIALEKRLRIQTSTLKLLSLANIFLQD